MASLIPDRSPPRYTGAVVLTVSLFFLWGMANNLNDILISQFRKAFALSDFGTSFVQQVFYLGYFVFAIPAAFLMNAHGYKAAIVTGLILYGGGALLFHPAATSHWYGLFLIALFVIASGLAFLETAANPLMTELGDPATAARRLNWAQAMDPLGAITGILVGRNYILSGIEHDGATLGAMTAAQRLAYHGAEVRAVQTPYLAIGIVVLGFAVIAAMLRFPANERAAQPAPNRAALRAVMRHPRLRFATVAQFCYVGAQVGLWSCTIRYAQVAVPGLPERTAADALFVSLVLFATGRFVGTMAMVRVRPATMLVAFAALSGMLVAVAALSGGWTGLYALVGASFFLSIQFPTIFALGVEGLGPLRRAGASLLVMAIIGGAMLTAAIGWVSDQVGIARAMLVPALAFVVIAAFGAWAGRAPAPARSREMLA